MIDRSIASVLQCAQQRLHASSTQQLDAALLLMHALNLSRTQLITQANQSISEEDIAQFETLVARREAGEPIAYIIGRQAFWDLELAVTPDVLIPRSETECIVEWVLDYFAQAESVKLADLGTGSGAIALAIARAKSHWQITATDRSDKALKIARDNARSHQISQVKFFQGDWCKALPEKDYDAIVCNPPYVAPGDPHLLLGDLRFEPTHTLVAKQAGFGDLFAVAAQAREHLKDGGRLLLEHGCGQAEQLQAFLTECGYVNIQILKDLAGLDRVTVCEWKKIG